MTVTVKSMKADHEYQSHLWPFFLTVKQTYTDFAWAYGKPHLKLEHPLHFSQSKKMAKDDFGIHGLPSCI